MVTCDVNSGNIDFVDCPSGGEAMTSPKLLTPVAATDRQVKRAAVLIADVVEFSRRMEQDEGGSVDQVSLSI